MEKKENQFNIMQSATDTIYLRQMNRICDDEEEEKGKKEKFENYFLCVNKDNIRVLFRFYSLYFKL